jgi:protease I
MPQHDLSNCRVAVLATDGFEQSELFEPLKALRDSGATVHIIAPKRGSIRGWNHTDWGERTPVDGTLASARPGDYDALLLPGGVLNPDTLRMDEQATKFARHFFDEGKPVAAICHGPQLLVECGNVLQGRRMTSYASVKTDMRNAGAHWVDDEVVVDNGLITSRSPDDLPAFNRHMIDEFERATHTRPVGQPSS